MSEVERIQKKARLGRGLGSLFGDGVGDLAPDPARNATAFPQPSEKAEPLPREIELKGWVDEITESPRIWKIAIEKIQANPKQPRRYFHPEKLKELADSIREKGVLQPILIKKSGDTFEIVAGERRWRAAQAAGLQEVPAIFVKGTDQEILEMALIENIQRHDLNPVEEAKAYGELSKTFNLTQVQIAERVGKDRATVANLLRLLNLPQEVLDLIISEQISTGHAKALLTAPDSERQIAFAKKCVRDSLSVRALERLLAQPAESVAAPDSLGIDISKTLIAGLQEDLQKALGTRVVLDYHDSKGKMTVYFYSEDELSELVEKLKRK